MPRFERSAGAEGPLVRGFSGTGFAVDGGIYEALLLSPERADNWAPPPLAELTIDHLAPLLAVEPRPEFVILGTGAAYRLPPRPLVAALEEIDIGVEAMDSRAAARTWSLLRGEQRWIVAAILPISV
jgi:uncharacterized protein